MIELEKEAEDYLKKILTGLPSNQGKLVRERVDDIAETFSKGYIVESQRIKKVSLSQCKGVIASVAEQMPPNIRNEILKKR